MLAEALAEFTNRDWLTTFSDKANNMALRVSLTEGEYVLACEDTITSGESVSKTIRAIEEAGSIVMPFIVTVCNRSGLQEIGGRKIISLITTPMKNWT